MNYTIDELKQLQKVNLDMAEYFVQFCKKHNLLCFLCGVIGVNINGSWEWNLGNIP